MILLTIRRETGLQHAEVEKKITEYIHKIKSPDDYKRLLQIFYGYINPVEQLITTHLNKDFVPDLNQRRNSNLLLNDLTALGAEKLENYCKDLPAITSNEKAIGALYVLEGSTLGGGIIAKMIKEKLNIAEGLSYFNNYGSQRSAMWKLFCSYLDHPGLQESADEISAGAKETFAGLGDWVDINKKDK